MCCRFNREATQKLKRLVSKAGGRVIVFKHLSRWFGEGGPVPISPDVSHVFKWKPGWNYPEWGSRLAMVFDRSELRTFGLHVFFNNFDKKAYRDQVRLVVRAKDIIACNGEGRCHGIVKKAYFPLEEYERFMGKKAEPLPDELLLNELLLETVLR